MDCETCRLLVSAHLDRETDDVEDRAMQHHLSGCIDCRHYETELVALTRSTRVRSAEPIPDLSDAVLARLPGGPPGIRVRVWARYGLVVVALTQLVLSLPELLPATNAAAPIHLEHHLGAWDIAMAVGLLVVARQPERARGLLPMALALGGILLLTAAFDVMGGNTVALSEAPHALELAGVAFLWCLTPAPVRRRWHLASAS